MSDASGYPPPGGTPGPPPPGTPAPQPAQQPWFPPPAPAYPQQAPAPYPAPYPATAYPAPPPGAWAPPPGYPPPMAPPAHKPGAIPIRPLGLGDLYDGAFKIIRSSPGATVGSAVMVTAVAMTIPILVTGFLTVLLDLSLGSLDGSGNDDVATTVAANGTVFGGALLQAFGLIFVTGMIAQVTSAATLGHKLTLAQAWAATRGKRAALVGLSFLLGLGTLLYLAVAVLVIVVLALALTQTAAIVAGIGVGLVSLLGLVYLWARVYYLAVPPLMLEPVGVLGALGRSWRLTSRQFWRTFGIALLTLVITQTAGSLLGIPFTIIGSVASVAAGDGQLGLFIFVLTTALAAVVSSAFVTPFTSTVTTLQYVDLRMRKEGYDVELLTRAGIHRP